MKFYVKWFVIGVLCSVLLLLILNFPINVDDTASSLGFAVGATEVFILDTIKGKLFLIICGLISVAIADVCKRVKNKKGERK